MLKRGTLLILALLFLLPVTVSAYDIAPGGHLKSIGFDEARKLLGKGRSNITVAVIDTGIDCKHKALTGAVVKHIDVFSNTEVIHTDNCTWDTTKIDCHGTHVAGIICGKSPVDSIDIGIAPGVSLLDIRALDTSGMESLVSIARGIELAVENNVDIINLSLGSENYDPNIDTAVRKATAAGIIVVCAMGNDMKSKTSQPADLPGVISVAAVNDQEQLAYFSNYGWQVNISAPGVDIFSSVVNEDGVEYLQNESKYGDYQYLSGTSMAAPVVSGCVALLKSKYPHLRLSDIMDILYETATLSGDMSERTYGSGLINLYQAAKLAGEYPVPQPLQKSDEKALYTVSNAIGMSAAPELPDKNLSPIYFDLPKLTGDFTHLEVLDPAGFTVYQTIFELNGRPQYDFGWLFLLREPGLCYYYDNQLNKLALLYEYSTYNNYLATGDYFLRLTTFDDNGQTGVYESPYRVESAVSNVELNTSVGYRLNFELNTHINDIPSTDYNDIAILACNSDDPFNKYYPVWFKNISGNSLNEGKHNYKLNMTEEVLTKVGSNVTFYLARGNVAKNQFVIFDEKLVDLFPKTAEGNAPAECKVEIVEQVVEPPIMLFLIIGCASLLLGFCFALLCFAKRLKKNG